MTVFNNPLLVVLVITTVLAFVIGWLVHKLTSGVRERSLLEKLHLQRKTIMDAKAKLKKKSSDLKAYEAQAIKLENSLTDGLVDMEIKYNRLQVRERDLKIKLSQLYKKKQQEIAELKDALQAVASVGMTHLDGDVVVPGEDGYQTIQQLENQLKVETGVYQQRIEELETRLRDVQLQQPAPHSRQATGFANGQHRLNGARATAETAPAVTPQLSQPVSEKDDLTQIHGIGPKIRDILYDMQITTFDQIAQFTKQDIQRVGQRLGKFSGRVERDQWIAQAKRLKS